MASTSKVEDCSNSDTDFANGELNVENDLTEEEFKEYLAAEAKSEGFDVPYYPHAHVPGMVLPMLNLNRYKDELDEYGGLAIKQYNDQNGTNFEMVEFVKVNTAVAAGFLYFMTFKAKPSGTPVDHPTTTFQARVFAGIQETEVDFCRKAVISG